MRKTGSDFVPLSFPDEKQNHDFWWTATKHWQSHFVTFGLRERCKDSKTLPALLVVQNPEFSRAGRRLSFRQTDLISRASASIITTKLCSRWVSRLMFLFARSSDQCTLRCVTHCVRRAGTWNKNILLRPKRCGSGNGTPEPRGVGWGAPRAWAPVQCMGFRSWAQIPVLRGSCAIVAQR